METSSRNITVEDKDAIASNVTSLVDWRQLLFFAVVLMVYSAERVHAEATRPNVLLIMCDDLGYSDLGCYGGEIQTPHLDRLAEDGLRFSQFYNCAVCVTTRSALLTGLYPRQAKRPYLRTNMVTLGEALGRAGYATSLTGKWHLGSEPPLRPIDRGFEEFYGVLDGCCNFFNPAQLDPEFYNGGRARPFAHYDKRLTQFPKDYYTTDAFSDHAATTIKRFAKGNKPFFVHLCYTAPHFPLHAFAEDIERYRGNYSDGYIPMRERRHERQAELGLFTSLPQLSAEEDKKGDFRYDYDVPDWEKLPASERKREEARMETYAAMVDRMDQGIGRVLTALDEAGVAENTVVMFLSDNGGCASWPNAKPGQEEGFITYNKDIPVGDGHGYEFVGKGWGWAQNAPFRKFKGWCYEGGIATPMIVRWPGKVARGSITHEVGHVIDLMPTLLELAESEYPLEFNGNRILPVEGRSLLPILQGQEQDAPRSLSWELFGNRAIRQGDWKLVWGASEKQWELYNLKNDRSETNDIASNFPERVTAMIRDWEAWRARVEHQDH
ncbi:arylsulfatase [Fuerstiella marisgermanici]|uniref:Arylsulfatase n=1 Tax=Fuerstiella marisgermanici TaxID=1891926 RepID=A0A1P8W8U9_9PLAN|nr:arylsulfatase [Fuerstiella marisgermanici]APZ90482.1 Arylsulfatase [Fuerstiella marisgermanici]